MEDVTSFLIGMIGQRPIEIAAVVLGLINVGLLVRRSIWNYPFGIVMVVLYAKIFYDAKLYSDAGLQIFFFAVQIYGWYYWSRSRDYSGKVIVRMMTARQRAAYGLAAIIGWACLGTAMSSYTDAAYPYWDSAIAVLSVIAQILLARRRLENWIVWIIVDILAIGLFWVKGLQPTAVLYGIFLVLATAGYFNWRRGYLSGKAIHR